MGDRRHHRGHHDHGMDGGTGRSNRQRSGQPHHSVHGHQTQTNHQQNDESYDRPQSHATTHHTTSSHQLHPATTNSGGRSILGEIRAFMNNPNDNVNVSVSNGNTLQQQQQQQSNVNVDLTVPSNLISSSTTGPSSSSPYVRCPLCDVVLPRDAHVSNAFNGSPANIAMRCICQFTCPTLYYITSIHLLE
jgi:hypothetical protein